MVPRKEMEKELKDQEKELTDDIMNLTKKVCPALPARGVPLIRVYRSRSTWKSSTMMLKTNCAILYELSSSLPLLSN